MATPTPILLCGKMQGHIQATCSIVQPDFRVIKVCSTLEDANSNITTHMSSSAPEKPKIIVMGGGFSNEDFKSIYDNVPGANSVPWIRPIGTKEGAGGGPPQGGPPPADEVAARLRKVLDAHLDDIKSGKGAGEVWWM
eukprot:TRINITY_DN2431_c0_g1_i1.p1 TRINITY_DN2431_c0_g1~~TRINITY_DN2431_c0_g1_i1.p1  ORF type:complete len:147 (+),score=52.63 TRINITY_DN2431_c0_g1_i1:28-441(+)